MDHIDPTDRARAVRLLARVVTFAQRLADLAAAYSTRLPEELRAALPAWAWLELGAVAQLCAWEEAGLIHFLGADIPRSEDSHRDLIDRLVRWGASVDVDRRRVTNAVHAIWFRSQGRYARAFPAVDVAVLACEADVAVIADFLWRFRYVANEVRVAPLD